MAEPILLDGKALATRIENRLIERVERIKQRTDGIIPILATILVGDDPASATPISTPTPCSRRSTSSTTIPMCMAFCCNTRYRHRSTNAPVSIALRWSRMSTASPPRASAR